MTDKILREQLIQTLNQGQAFMPLKKLISTLPPDNHDITPPNANHSIYEIFEHMRIAQNDIINFTLIPDWESPQWPDNYWPPKNEKVTDTLWEKSVTGFWNDFNKTINLIKNENIDLTSEIPHAKGYTYLREILLIAEHNAYHTGQILYVNRMLKD